MYRLNVDRHSVDATGFQRFLCQLSISELPQLLNVLSGEMSLVGPRPETLKRIGEYSEWQRQRLNVRPGMTGLAQVNGLREQHSSDEKTRYDLQYIVRRTPIFDLILLLETIWTLAARLFHSTDAPAPPLSKDDQSVPMFSRSATQNEGGDLMLIVRSPVRISFGGGGTDLPAYYERYGGAVLSTTINKYFYTVLTKRGDDKIQVISSDLQVIETWEDIARMKVVGEPLSYPAGRNEIPGRPHAFEPVPRLRDSTGYRAGFVRQCLREYSEGPRSLYAITHDQA